MGRARLIGILAAALAGVGGTARAGETRCWFEAGVVVVPAEVAGVVGDYILDTGSPLTTVHDTIAQANGVEGASVHGDVRLAGEAAAGLDVPVAGLDLRTWNLPTPVAGVIGADVLRGFVLDVRFSPCRVRLWRPGAAPRFHGRTLPIAWEAGRPTVVASAGDGVRRLTGPFVVATGANAPVRLADDLASAPGAAKPDELQAQGVWLARLAEVRFAGRTVRNPAAGLSKETGEAAGILGGDFLAGWRLRFDFPAERLTLAPK